MTHRADDPWAVLGLERNARTAPGEIERAYLEAMSGAHPDRGGAGDAERLNRARRTLLDAESRCNTLLHLIGGPGPSDDKSLPDGFLMEIMDTRMEIEEAIALGGDADRDRWNDWAEDRRAEYAERVAALFDSAGDELPKSSGVEIRKTLNAWRYIERLIEQLDPAYDPGESDFDPAAGDL